MPVVITTSTATAATREKRRSAASSASRRCSPPYGASAAGITRTSAARPPAQKPTLSTCSQSTVMPTHGHSKDPAAWLRTLNVPSTSAIIQALATQKARTVSGCERRKYRLARNIAPTIPRNSMRKFQMSPKREPMRTSDQKLGCRARTKSMLKKAIVCWMSARMLPAKAASSASPTMIFRRRITRGGSSPARCCELPQAGTSTSPYNVKIPNSSTLDGITIALQTTSRGIALLVAAAPATPPTSAPTKNTRLSATTWPSLANAGRSSTT